MPTRLARLREVIDDLIRKLPPEHARAFYIHAYAVSKFGILLARRRGLDAELAAVCGMLHDIYVIATGVAEEHAVKGAVLAEEMLRTMGGYSDDEIALICAAISHHSDKLATHGAYDELLKDADVLSHCLYDPDAPVAQRETTRFRALMLELGCGEPTPNVELREAMEDVRLRRNLTGPFATVDEAMQSLTAE